MDIKQHDIVQTCGVDHAVSVLVYRALPVIHHDLRAEAVGADAHDILLVDLLQPVPAAFEDAVPVKDLILTARQQYLSFVDEGQHVGNLFQVRGDMRRHEDRALSVLQILHENVQDLVADDGVQPGRRFVHDKQLGAVRQRAGDLQFHFHAL